jgi:hypothetical protein
MIKIGGTNNYRLSRGGDGGRLFGGSSSGGGLEGLDRCGLLNLGCFCVNFCGRRRGLLLRGLRLGGEEAAHASRQPSGDLGWDSGSLLFHLLLIRRQGLCKVDDDKKTNLNGLLFFLLLLGRISSGGGLTKMMRR